jgi:two-component system CheB/CheR fusion protein
MIRIQETEQLVREIEGLRLRLEEAEETIRAIQTGKVDAVLVQAEREQVFTLESADRPYRLLVEQMPQGAATLTVEGTILYCNRHFADLLGRPLPSLLGASVQTFVNPASRPLFEALLREGQAASTQGEVTLERADGTAVPVYLGVNALEEGALGLCLMVTDLTQQKRQEALVAAEALARSILDQAVDVIVVCEAAGKVIRACNGASELAGRNLLLQPFEAVFPLRRSEGMAATGPGEASGEPAAILPAVLRGETLRGLETCLKRPDGRTVDLLVSAGPLRDSQGQIVGCVITLTDISERKRLEGELRRQAEQLAEADRRKDEFLATLAHELRNPLAPLRHAVQFLQLKGPPEPELRAARAVIDRQVQHLTRLVDDLLDVGRISQGKVELRRQPIRLAAVVESAVETSRPLIEACRHELTVTLPVVPVWLDADPMRLAQVVANLLNNAAKYTEAGGRIDLTAAREGQEALVRVRDTGVGLPAEMLERIFEPFAQVDRSLGRAQGGLGIGLTLVKSLVEMHGGSVHATSAGPGRGSEFVVRLPVAQEPGRPEEAAEGKAPVGPKEAPCCRVLVVDDNEDAARMLAMLLELEGNQVSVAHDGPGALAAARTFHPDVVLLDISLPGMDGYEVARRVRQLPGMQGVVLIAQTGWGQEEDRHRSRAAGCDAHLLKPVELETLQELLKSLRPS